MFPELNGEVDEVEDVFVVLDVGVVEKELVSSAWLKETSQMDKTNISQISQIFRIG